MFAAGLLSGRLFQVNISQYLAPLLTITKALYRETVLGKSVFLFVCKTRKPQTASIWPNISFIKALKACNSQSIPFI